MDKKTRSKWPQVDLAFSFLVEMVLLVIGTFVSVLLFAFTLEYSSFLVIYVTIIVARIIGAVIRRIISCMEK